MKKHTEKPPIDDLFARKLGDMSIRPSADAFDRLQARMGHDKQEKRVVFWRNPNVQRYMAAAACLLLVALFGWLYLSSEKGIPSGKSTIAANSSKQKQAETEMTLPNASPTEPQIPQSATPAEIDRPMNEESLAQTVSPSSSSSKKAKSQVTNKAFEQKIDVEGPARTPESEPALAQVKSVDNKPKEDMASEVATPSTPVTSEQLATNTSATQGAERVLVVTISEPKALVAARQAAVMSVEEKPVVATNSKAEKDTRAGNLWSQVKRLKQGEIFARQNTDEDDRGLLGRAYNGLKHNFDKDKPLKQ